jgi:hypothetical protein
MAPNSSSVFNEAPTETKPSSTPGEPPLTSTAPETRPVATPSSSSSSVATASDCSAKQVAPKMEQHVDDLPASSTPTDASDVAAALRFGCVPSASELDDSKKTMVFRKSCLKRQSSFSPSSLNDIHPDAIKIEKVEILSASSLQEDEKEKEPAAPVQKNRRRCWECKAKVGLTAVTCRCDFTFCNKHRYAEEHNCRFNFKSAAKRKLEVENPRVVPSKVARIN